MRWHGWGFEGRSDHVEIEMASRAEGLTQFIANTPEVKGIGPSRAAKIVQAFKIDVKSALLLEAPERVGEVAKVPLRISVNLCDVTVRTPPGGSPTPSPEARPSR